MQNSKTIIVGYCVALFMMVMLLPVNAYSTAQPVNNWLDEPVTIRFQNEPLSKILERISKQTGIAILYDQELANEKVSGNYRVVKASDAITRLFSGKNKSIQVSKYKKVIVVKTFGAKDFIWAGTNKSQDSSSQMTLAELEKMHAQQYIEYKERVADDNEIVEGGEGMTRGEIRAMQEQQFNEYRERITNDDEIIGVGDKGKKSMTRGELRDMHAQQYRDYKERFFNDDEIIEVGDEGKEGMTRGELRAMHEKQYNIYKERITNDNEIIEGGEEGKGMTRGELRAMHATQYKSYKERLKDRTRIIE